ncbi:na+/H+ antiporter NhaA, partial [Vibrio parahaemolyticus V-223/04]
CLHLRTQVSR